MTLIEELERLRDAATPGPWCIYSEPEVGLPPSIFVGEPMVSGFRPLEPIEDYADQNLIIALRNNLPTIIAALKAAEWRPIEEAPKNGTPILVFIPFQWSSGEGASVWDVAHWDEHTAKWTTRTAPNYYQHCDPECQPTHFKPLGPGPEGEE